MLNEIIQVALKYPGHQAHQYLTSLYNYWKDRPIARAFCERIENSGIIEGHPKRQILPATVTGPTTLKQWAVKNNR